VIVERTSPLWCRVNGVLLGQLLALAHTDCGRARYEPRRVRVEAVLRELDVDVAVPATADEAAAGSHAALLARLVPRLALRSRELAEFTILGGLLTHYTLAAQRGAGAAAALLTEIERLRAAWDLPPLDPRRLSAAGDADRLLAPGLAYLRDIVTRLPVEEDTALVIAPLSAAGEEVYAGFARPSLEHCGYRVLRVWASIPVEEYADLQLAIVGRCGLVWADVSELDHEVLHRIGAAHALGRTTVIVARADRAGVVPDTIGHDAVVRYDPADPDWPGGSVLLMAACLAAIRLAAERGDRLRVTPDSIAGVFDEVSQALGRVLVPPEARDAQRRGRRAMDAGDLVLAESCFDQACRLGLNDDETRLWRGWARVGLGRLDAAAADLDAVLAWEPAGGPPSEWRPIAAYLRGVLREARGDHAGAIADLDLALSLGLADPEVREKRDALAARRHGHVDPLVPRP
jgi:tetratricopeptide (TPR) repeat protein